MKELPEINIGLVGHVAHGKTILTKSLTGKLTLQHSEELKRGITLKLGYADAKFYKCNDCEYYFSDINNSKTCPKCFSKNVTFLRTVSFIDAPGHETLMSLVLTASSLMDGAILVIASNEKCPQPQTEEHLKALEIAEIKNVIIAQTKIDLVRDKQKILEHYNQIKEFIKDSLISNSPIIPVSAQFNINIEYLIECIEKYIPTPIRNEKEKPIMYAIRSFDTNLPGTKVKDLKGAIFGGSVIKGKFKENDEIEIKPPAYHNGKFISLTSKIVEIRKSGIKMEEATPGGLIGIQTDLDPSVARLDSLAGRIIALLNELPKEVFSLSFEINYLKRSVFIKEEEIKINNNDVILINVGPQRSVGIVKNIKENYLDVQLKFPIVLQKNDRILVSKQIRGSWRLIGYGNYL
ncbi:MAG: translation initiation factor IF-2 subunit gamma [Candidatus Aenigmatarchaeota archaeon]